MRLAAVSHVGMVRKVNQDGYLARQAAERFVIVVADGMGGHVAGEVASRLAVDTVWDILAEPGDPSSEDEAGRLKRAIHGANAAIHEAASAQASYAGMGTTVVAALANLTRVWTSHVGDSRAYLLSVEGTFTQLTEDHSLVNELVRRGQLLPEEAETHPQRHLLTRALGTLPAVAVECGEWAWGEGDILLVCSDGLTSEVPRERLEATLRGSGTLHDRVAALVDAALESGGRDNITIVALQHDGDLVRREDA